MTKEELKENLPENWEFHDNNGWVHIKAEDKEMRVRIDPPDKDSPYPHMHIYDENKNPLDIDGNIVNRTDPEAHIPWDK